MADDYKLARNTRKEFQPETHVYRPLKSEPELPTSDAKSTSPDYLLHHGYRPGGQSFDNNTLHPENGGFKQAGDPAPISKT